MTNSLKRDRQSKLALEGIDIDPIWRKLVARNEMLCILALTEEIDHEYERLSN